MSSPAEQNPKMDFRTATFERGAVSMASMPDDGLPEIAFIGRSNVGKSSLINKLLGRKNLARTSSTPGKTQEINFFLIDESFHVVDLPGFGYARVSKSQRASWKKLIGSYLRFREPLRLVFHLIDSRHPPGQIDRDILLLIKESDAVPVILLTKTDKLSSNTRQRALRDVDQTLAKVGLEIPVILTSASDGRGRTDIIEWISTLLP